ncbi:MAG: tetratricopeptide repeat protein [Capnocytophaga sp.]|nr:tetratricopeptide repeat protein [Capnocytophaga sp.]
MKRNILSLSSLFLLGFVATSWSQATEAYTNPENEYHKALSLYNRKLYKPAQQLFREQYLHSGDADVRSQSQYYTASTAIRLGEPGADALMQKFIDENPDSPLGISAYMDVANFYFQQGNYKSALQWYDKINDSEINWQDKDRYNFQKGYALFASGKRKEAEKYFNQVRSSKEFGSDANYYLGYIAYDSDDYSSASTYFERVQDDEQLSKNLSYFQADMNFKQGKFEAAAQEGLKQLGKTRNPQEVSELNKIIGESYFNLKKYKEALPYLKEYKGKRGKYSNTDYYYLGYAYYQQKEYGNAIEQFNKIIGGRDAVAQNAYYHLAECYLETGQKQQALNAFRNAYQMDFEPQIKKDAHLNYARLSYDIGNPYESVPGVLLAYQQAYPNDNKEEIQRLLIDSYISSGNYQAAIDLLEKSSNPKDKEIYQKAVFYRGLELYNEKQYESALKYLKKAVPAPGALGARALYWAGESAYQLNDFAEAKTYFVQFLNHSQSSSTSEYGAIYYNLAYADFNQKNYGEAITNFDKYLKTNPSNKVWANDANLRLADAYFVEGKYWPAMETYNKVINSKAEDEDYAAYQKAISYGFVDRTARKIEDLEAFVKKYTTSNLRQGAMFELANTYVSQGNDAKALQLYSRIQSEYKNGNYVPRAMLREGLVYYNQNNNQKALEVFRKIARDYPSTTESTQAVATAKLIYVDTGKVDEYATWAKSLGYVDVSDAELDSATYEAAERQYMQQNEKEAIAGFEKYLSQFPQGLRANNARFYLAQLYYGANQKAKALPLYERVAEGGTGEFTEQALTRLTQILLDENNDAKAKPYLETLERTSVITQNKIYAQSNLMRIYYNDGQYAQSVAYANKVLAEKSVDNRVRNDAQTILARSNMKTGDEANARKAYAQVQKTATGSLAAEALYYDAYFKNKDKNYKASNETVQKLAKEYGGYKEFAAKGLVVMAKNFQALGDAYQASYILESVITNFADYPEVVAEARRELASVKAEAAKSNSSVQL